MNVLQLANDADPLEVELEGVERIELHFPKFSDGRAFSQAFLLRRRLRFQGDIRATGDVLIDQLRADAAQRLFQRRCCAPTRTSAHASASSTAFADFYQGDVIDARPLFRKAA